MCAAQGRPIPQDRASREAPLRYAPVRIWVCEESGGGACSCWPWTVVEPPMLQLGHTRSGSEQLQDGNRASHDRFGNGTTGLVNLVQPREDGRALEPQ